MSEASDPDSRVCEAITRAGSPEERARASRLSITAAASEAGDAIAIITATRTLTFAECARLAEAPPRAIVAHPAVATILAVYGALEAKRPLGLVHAKLPAAQRAAQLAQLEGAELPDGTAFVLFTSGSTGAAKGVILSRDAILAAAAASAAQLGWRDDDRWLSCLPMAHSGGLSIAVRCLVARRPVVLHDGDFATGAVRALAEATRATLASFVPAQLAALTGASPPALRAIILGGAAAAPALVADAVARGWPVLPSYGLTETFGQIATARAPGGPLVALPGVTIAAGPSGSATPLRVRGPMLATAYLGGAAIAPELVTADLGRIDPDGTLHVLGRRDDVIITGGEKVHPLEIEAVLAATPGVRGAHVFAVADQRWGHVVAAALATDATFDDAAAYARWHAALPSHARPRRIAVLAELPQLPSGKLDRRAIAALPTVPIAYGSDAIV